MFSIVFIRYKVMIKFVIRYFMFIVNGSFILFEHPELLTRETVIYLRAFQGKSVFPSPGAMP